MNSGTSARNIILSLFLVPVLILLLGAGIFLYLFNGEQISNATIDQRVHSTLQRLLGEDYSITMEETGLSFSTSSVITLKSNNIVVTRSADGAKIATFDEVEVGLDFLTAIQGTPQFDKLTIDGGKIEVGNLKTDSEGPIKLRKGLSILSSAMANLEQPFADRTIRAVSFNNLTISSLSLNRREASDINVTKADFAMADDGQLNLNATAASKLSQFTVNAAWRQTPEGGRLLSLGAGEISSLEWFEPVEVDNPSPPGLSLDAKLRLDARFPFDAQNQPMQPFLKFQMAGGEVRIGLAEPKTLQSSVVNLKLFPDDGHVEMEPSELRVGETVFELTGSLNVLDSSQGLRGPLSIDLVAAARARDLDGQNPEQIFAASGQISNNGKTLVLDEVSVIAGEEKISGNLSLGFGDGSPSIEGRLISKTLSVPHLLNAWPSAIAPNVQVWIGKNVSAGALKNLAAKFAIPGGRLDNLSGKSGFKDGEFSISSDLDNITVKTVGDLPLLEKAGGNLLLDGNQFSVSASRGILAANKDSVEVNSLQLNIENLFATAVPAKMTATLSGKLQPIATIASKQPLSITKSIAINPDDLSGDAIIDLSLVFDLVKTGKPNKLQWKSDIALVDAASKTDIFGRSIKNANLKLKADDTMIAADGTATIDGFDAKLKLTEPINGASPSLRKRNIKMTVDQNELAKQGINLAPVVKGKLDLEIASEGAEADTYKIDLSQTDISLPWISWLKGTGIAASASFSLNKSDGISTLENFSFAGDGFKAAGKMSFNKSGLVSLDLKNVKLVRDDNFNVAVVNSGSRLEVTASGKSFDARSLINQIVHKDGFSSTKSKVDVSLTANFGRVVGFNDQVMENALISYSTEKGQFDSFKVQGALDGEVTNLGSVRKNGVSHFDFSSTNAGATLAMVNIYKKMRGGKLNAKLSRSGSGPYIGPVVLSKFTVVGEDRLASLVSAPVADRSLERASGKLREIDVREVSFRNMEATITKSSGYLEVKDGRVRNSQIGLTFEGVIFDQSNQMSVRGTFMPLFSISRIIGEIPIIGDILSNGKNSGLIGITYRLRGAANNPKISVNPISVIAPGVFKKIFQFEE